MQRIDVVMPQLGQSVAEGTVSRWFKGVGDDVARDEPLLEVTTDKITTEIPSPVSGRLAEIRAEEGTTVPVGDSLAVIESEEGPAGEGGKASGRGSAPARSPAPNAPARSGFLSPAVRKLVRERGLSESDLASIRGSGKGGRVTREDVLAFEERVGGEGADGIEWIPMDARRRGIADHMTERRNEVPHVTSVHEADVGAVVTDRKARAASLESEHAIRLTYTPYFVRAAARTIREFPLVNAVVDGHRVGMRKGIHIGIAVAVDDPETLGGGLLVPVIRDADAKDLTSLAREIHDLTTRARSGKLTPDETAGGTFTVTNPGVFGGLFGTPIVPRGQSAILGVGAIVERPVVEAEAVVVRPRAYLTLTYDHRIVDGALGNRFLRRMVELLRAPD